MVYRGDSGRFRITVTEPDEVTPVDVSLATWDADIRVKPTDTTALTSFDITPVSGDVSSIDVMLPPDKSILLNTNCVYDIEMTLAGKVFTIIGGKITVTQDVSRP
jgi:hypothetical protein